MKTLTWVDITRKSIKSKLGFGWSVQGIEKQNKVKTKVVYRFSTGQRTTVLTDLDWHAENNNEITNLVVELSDLMNERSVDLVKAYELISGGKLNKNGKNEINWFALKEEFINEERGNRRDTTKRDLKKRLDRTLQALNTKPLPRNAEQLFKNYADLFFDRNMPKGGEGRKRNMGDLRAFLNWAVLEKKYLGVEWLPLTAKQYAKYVGAVPKGRKKNRTREPILTADFEMLLEALKRENKHGLRAICVLSGVYGIRVSEIANMKIKDGKVEITTLKQNVKTMLEEPHTRIVEPLDLPNLPNLGKEIVADLESGKIKFPDPILRAIAKSDDEKGYKEIGERFGKMINRFWFWKELKTKYSNLVPYSFRHSFAWRGSMETVPAIPYRVLADLLGHDLDTHLKYYGKWSNNAENKKRIEEANKNNAEKYVLART